MADVLLVSPDMHKGGVGRCVYFMAHELPKHGVSTALFCLHDIENEFEVTGVPLERAVPNKLEGGPLVGLLAPLMFLRMVMAIRRLKPAIVCSHGLLCNILTAMARPFMPRGVRTVAFEHNSPSGHYWNTRLGGLKRALLRYAYNRHDVVVGVSKGVAQDLMDMEPALRGKCLHVYNGIPLDEVRRQGTAPLQAGLPADGRFQVVSVGRLVSSKGWGTLIEAAALLDDPGIVFTIVGDGPERAEFEAQIARRPLRSEIRLVGHADNPFPFLAGADVFLSVSERESFGIVLVEALCLGVPVIATDCPTGPSEILGEGAFGELVPVGDAVAVANAIRTLRQDSARCAKLAQLGPERAADFSVERQCSDMIQLFQPMLRNVDASVPRSIQ
jgi:glycosyltransferase involved in cell wall biosynthesis